MEHTEKPIFKDGIWKGIVRPPIEGWQHFRSTLLERLNKYPFRVGQIDASTGQKDLYGDMADRITSCSMWLKKGNVQPGDIIGICTSNNLNAVIPLVASLLAEAIPNPWWDAVLTDDTIKHFLNLTKPKIIFSDEMKIKKIKEVVDKTGENIRIVCLGDIPGFESLNHIIENTDPDAMAKFKCEDLKDLQEAAVILYTSGTSGYPKGVLLPYSCLIAEMGPMCETPEIIFRTAGINWITGLMNALVTIGACSTTVIHPNLDEKIILEIVEKYKVKRISCLNTAHAIRLWTAKDLRDYDVSSLESIPIGGSTVPAEVDEFVQKYFKNGAANLVYGCTELGGIAIRQKWTGKPGSCGQPGANHELKVVDIDTGKILGPNEKGEFFAKYPYGMLGYFNDPDATKAAYDEEGWYSTGDFGYYDADGELFVLDRLKELIKFRMIYHIAPGVIEKVILNYPGVFEAAVLARPHVKDIEQPMAFISLRSKAKVTESDIIDHVAKNLPDHMRLRGGVKILDKLPYTNSGKISKRELRDIIKSLEE